MLTKSHVALATLALVAVCNDIRTKKAAKKSAELYLAASQAYEETEAAHMAIIEYLCHLLDQNGVVIDEFDLIALSNPM